MALDNALEAYAQLDGELFAASYEVAVQGMACLDRPLSTDEQAQLWLVRGLKAWLRRDEADVAASFGELLALQPDFAPDPELVPPGSRLNDILEQARLDRVAEPLPAPPALSEPDAFVELAMDPAPAVDSASPLSRPSRALLGAGLASAAVGVASAVVAQRAQDGFWSSGARDEAERAYQLNRLAGFTAYGAAGVSAGLVLGAVVVGRW